MLGNIQYPYLSSTCHIIALITNFKNSTKTTFCSKFNECCCCGISCRFVSDQFILDACNDVLFSILFCLGGASGVQKIKWEFPNVEHIMIILQKKIRHPKVSKMLFQKVTKSMTATNDIILLSLLSKITTVSLSLPTNPSQCGRISSVCLNKRKINEDFPYLLLFSTEKELLPSFLGRCYFGDAGALCKKLV